MPLKRELLSISFSFIYFFCTFAISLYNRELKKKLIHPLFLCATLMMLCISWCEQNQIEIQDNRHYSAGDRMAYPTLPLQRQPTAPDGKKPFYISYYGCHGSSRLHKPSAYEKPYQTMARANKLGKLTPFGKDVFERLDLLRLEAQNRWGELTPLGISQQYAIANRMVDRHPEMFRDSVKIIAHSQLNTRSILSMEQMLLQLSKRCGYRVYHSASNAYAYYLYHLDEETLAKKRDAITQSNYITFVKNHPITTNSIERLFSDKDYVCDSIDATALNQQLFRLAGVIQNTPLGGKVTLDDLFSEEELRLNWEQRNALNYINYGNFTHENITRPFVQPQLLKQLISLSDSCMTCDIPHIFIHIGDETGLIPLVCQMGINGYGLKTDNLETLADQGWKDYKISPASGNIQVVFYRRDMDDDDTLVWVLLNEEEATLPIETDVAPFYHWNDVKAYYLKLIESHE